MTLVTYALWPRAIHAKASGCWREWHSEDNNLEGEAVSNVNRKHAVSIAVSMALLAAAAASAAASEAEGPAPADQSTTPAPDTGKSRVVEESTVTVYGVRQSQIKSIEANRT